MVARGWSRIAFSMNDSHAIGLDTAPEAREIQFDLWRRASSTRKAEMISALCADIRELALAGVRERHPRASAREALLRVGALTIDRELMIAAFGWDPEREGR